MEGFVVLFILAMFFLGLFLPQNSITDEEVAANKKELDKLENTLKSVDNLYKEWDILTEKRKIALKEYKGDWSDYNNINEEIDSIKLRIKWLLK